jgi:hypothetical protein
VFVWKNDPFFGENDLLVPKNDPFFRENVLFFRKNAPFFGKNALFFKKNVPFFRKDDPFFGKNSQIKDMQRCPSPVPRKVRVTPHAAQDAQGNVRQALTTSFP